MSVEPTEANREALAAYVTELQAMFHLEHWDVTLSREPADDDDVVNASISINNPSATWRFGESFWQDDPVEQRVHIVHELLHLHLHHAHGDLLEALERQTSRAAWSEVFTLHRRNHERSVERLAQALAIHYPVIEWPETPGTDSP